MFYQRILALSLCKKRPDKKAKDNEILHKKRRVSYLYRTAQPSTLACFRTWGSSIGAGRIRLTRRKSKIIKFNSQKTFRYFILIIFAQIFFMENTAVSPKNIIIMYGSILGVLGIFL